MKAAVSIPDDIFGAAERLARKLRTSRSNLYARALAQFVARHDDDEVTASMNAALARIDQAPDAFAQEAARRVLRRVPW
jgi:predicted transcriptional regulator